jgi:ABC-type branched-subunit amino acid transport system ATPase component
MLSAQGLTLTFNPGTPIETRALRGLSLEIPSGQFVAVIGSNGAGKSTFLNSISGDQLVDSGRITIDGNDVTRKTAWQRADLVARVFQDPMAGTCENLTIEENMSLAMCRGQRRGGVHDDQVPRLQERRQVREDRVRHRRGPCHQQSYAVAWYSACLRGFRCGTDVRCVERHRGSGERPGQFRSGQPGRSGRSGHRAAATAAHSSDAR